MSVEYTERDAPVGDLEGDILGRIAEGLPYVLAVCEIADGGSLKLVLKTNVDGDTVRAILCKTIAALPGGDGQ